MRRGLITAVAAALAAAAFAAPASASGGAGGGTIVDVAVGASGGGAPDSNPRDYDLLVQAVLATNLAPTLSDRSQRFTVFAPNDRAFKRLVADLTGRRPASESAALAAITDAFTVAQIRTVLLYHVVAGRRLGPLQVVLSRQLTMANGGVVRPRGIRLVDETPALRDPRLVLRAIGIRASNGVIHTINRVLVPARP